MGKFSVALLVVFVIPAWADSEPSPEALERWFESDEMTSPYDDKISEGELRFLASPPEKRTTSISNKIDILNNSLESGWVSIDQCYSELDPIDDVEVVYRYHNMRKLKIVSTKHIRKAWVEGQSVQLKAVAKGAELCVSLQAQIFYKQGKRNYVLRNGPFERRFLDGYYPLHVKLNISFPASQLRFIDSKPAVTTGFNLRQTPGSVQVDAWFEGKLTTELMFGLIND